MSSYNTTTISNVFSKLYANLRRVYSEYVINWGARQFFVYADVVLKNPGRTPFFSSKSAAIDGTSPSGLLPIGISPYYLRERPIYVSNIDQAARAMTGQGQWDMVNNKPVIILNLFLNGKYTNVYLPYNPSLHDLKLHLVDAIQFVDQEASIVATQSSLNTLINLTVQAYNQTRVLLAAQKAGKYSNVNFLTRSTYGAIPFVEGMISKLQSDSRLVVKVCTECSASIGLSAITYITIAGGISLNFFAGAVPYLQGLQVWIDDRIVEMERLRIGLDREIKSLSGAVAVVSPEDAAGYNNVTPMQSVTVTAQKNKNWLWLLLVAGAAGIAISKKGKK